jgi:uncharacterized protein YjbI with pentapeptide repeats
VVAKGGSGNDRCLALMLTVMSNALRRLVIAVISVLAIFAAFAAGMGIYAATLALWPFVLVWWPWLLAGAVAVVVLGAWWLWWRLPKRQVDRLRLTIRDPKARADVEDNFRKTISQLLAGVAVLLGAALAYLQFTQQQRASQEQFSEQQRAAQEQFTQQQKTAQQQLSEQQQASRELLVSNQVSKGFEQLGSDKLVVRLGGIYALEGVMNTSEQYHQPVLEALCAFVRDNTRRDNTRKEKSEVPPTTEIQAALTVIGRRKIIGPEQPLNLSNAHIPYAQLNGAHLSGANLKSTNLSGANLSGAFLHDAHLSGAFLRYANLSGADLSDAHLITSYSNLSGANLSGANLSGATLDGANLSGAHLRNANLDGATLDGANLSGADLSGAANITQVQLNGACGTAAKLDPGLTIKCQPQ